MAGAARHGAPLGGVPHPEQHDVVKAREKAKVVVAKVIEPSPDLAIRDESPVQGDESSPSFV
ncbi:MAG TPA: hypothetical protein VLI39_11340 [Sedimentisphaerales bacterium]|nr:hypothetical protein [Sedimentisphaerales bacterium]